MKEYFIRVEPPEGAGSCNIFIDWYDEDGSGAVQSYFRLVENLDELEPAPPKDWRPICYDSQYNKLNGCDPGRIITNTCQQCPWLAARHKTEVNRKME